MSTIAENLERIQNAKNNIKSSIINKGVTVPTTAKIDDFPNLIDNIQCGTPNWVNGWIFKNDAPINLQYTFPIIYNDEIHILGGHNASTAHYKFNGKSWISVSTIPINFKTVRAVVYNNEIHIFSNSRHYKWDGITWSSVSTLPYVVSSSNSPCFSVVVFDNEIHILGSSYLTSYYKYHYKWNGTSWESVSTLPTGANAISEAIVYNNEIHLLSIGDHYKWNINSWTRIVSNTELCVQGYSPFLIHNNKLYIYDNNIMYRFNGSYWLKDDTIPMPPHNTNQFCDAIVYKDYIILFNNNTNSDDYFTNKLWMCFKP